MAGAATYFSGMVVAAIVAALAILLAIICAVCLVRKSSHAKAPITAARKNGPSYENPAFKVSVVRTAVCSGLALMGWDVLLADVGRDIFYFSKLIIIDG